MINATIDAIASRIFALDAYGHNDLVKPDPLENLQLQLLPGYISNAAYSIIKAINWAITKEEITDDMLAAAHTAMLMLDSALQPSTFLQSHNRDFAVVAAHGMSAMHIAYMKKQDVMSVRGAIDRIIKDEFGAEFLVAKFLIDNSFLPEDMSDTRELIQAAIIFNKVISDRILDDAHAPTLQAA